MYRCYNKRLNQNTVKVSLTTNSNSWFVLTKQQNILSLFSLIHDLADNDFWCFSKWWLANLLLPNQTPVTEDVLTLGIIFAFIIIAFSLFAILPGIRGWQVRSQKWYWLEVECRQTYQLAFIIRVLQHTEERCHESHLRITASIMSIRTGKGRVIL